MSIPVEISDEERTVRITKNRELVTAPSQYDTATYHAMDADNTAFNFALPLAHKQFVVTGFLAVSDKNVTADAIIEIYEADSPTTITPINVEEGPKFALTKNSNVSPTPLRFLIASGVYLNAKTTDATIHLTIFGYYINQIE